MKRVFFFILTWGVISTTSTSWGQTEVQGQAKVQGQVQTVTQGRNPVQVARIITGKLVDRDTEQPIPQANIRVLQKAVRAFVSGKASDDDGSFSIPVRNVSYIVKVSFIGYHDLLKRFR